MKINQEAFSSIKNQITKFDVAGTVNDEKMWLSRC